MNRSLVFMLVVTACGVFIARCVEAAEDQEADLRAAIATIDQQVQQLKTTHDIPSEAAVMATLDPDERRALEGLTNLSGTGKQASEVREQLRQAGIQLFGRDVLATAITAKLIPGGYRDPTPEMTYDAGQQGLLWVFWACDAPGIEMLPGQLLEAQKTWPELTIRDSHVMRLSDWNRFARRMWELKEQLEAVDPMVDLAKQLPAKRAARDAALPPLMAMTTMAGSRRQGGYLLVEDMTAATSYDVHRLPTIVFLSPRGIVHRTTGLNPRRSIAVWMTQVLTWENENYRVLQQRGDLPIPQP